MYEILRKMGFEGRVRMAFELIGNLRKITEAGVRQRHPDDTEHQAQLGAIRLAIGEELFKKVYPNQDIQP